MQRHFRREIALLHSFSYYADNVFREVGARDPQCAMRIGALHDTHQLWQPCLAADAYGVEEGKQSRDAYWREDGTEDTVIAPKVQLVILY